jgi:AcrR family transcriptional regulator
MYHISNDKRVLKSANLIYKGFLECLKFKNLQDVTIMDISHMSGVSRTTFYRLFDNTIDVIHWKCEQILHEAILNIDHTKSGSFEHIFINFTSSWLKNQHLLEILVKCSRTDILYNVHIQNITELQNLFLAEIELTELEKDYLSSMLAAIIPSIFRVLTLHPENYPKLVFMHVKKSLNLLETFFTCHKY